MPKDMSHNRPDDLDRAFEGFEGDLRDDDDPQLQDRGRYASGKDGPEPILAEGEKVGEWSEQEDDDEDELGASGTDDDDDASGGYLASDDTEEMDEDLNRPITPSRR
jgi:hypothetical protein